MPLSLAEFVDPLEGQSHSQSAPPRNPISLTSAKCCASRTPPPPIKPARLLHV